MSVDVSRAAADAYFDPASHVRAAAWEALSERQQEAALAHAARIISREISAEVGDEDADADGYYRPDYAVFEQALSMMLRSAAVPNAERTGPHYMAVGDDGEETARAEEEQAAEPYALSAEAASYLQRPRRALRVLRG